MNNKKLRINLVTGGAGFLGSHLVDSLMIAGEKVICLDNFSTGSLKNINCWLKNKNFIYEDFDVRNQFNCKVDRIWHLASPASPKKYIQDPISTISSCFEGTYNMLELARKCKARILLSSTSEIYGDANQASIAEDYYGNVNSFSERACYSEGKRISETLFFNYKNFHKIDIRVARIFNTYGSRLSAEDGRVIPYFLKQIYRGKPIQIFGDGRQTRSFCYVADMIKALRVLMDSSYDNPINLGSDRSISIKDLALLISKKLEKPLIIENCSKLEGDPLNRKPCIDMALKELNWKPEVNLESGLDILISDIMNL